MDAVGQAFAVLSEQPGAGSTRYRELRAIEGLRSWILTGFPYMVFYLHHDEVIDVIRLLHQHSAILAILQDSKGSTRT